MEQADDGTQYRVVRCIPNGRSPVTYSGYLPMWSGALVLQPGERVMVFPPPQMKFAVTVDRDTCVGRATLTTRGARHTLMWMREDGDLSLPMTGVVVLKANQDRVLTVTASTAAVL